MMVIDDRRLVFTTLPIRVFTTQVTTFSTGHEFQYVYEPRTYTTPSAPSQPQTKAEKNQARLKQLRGRAGRWA